MARVPISQQGVAAVGAPTPYQRSSVTADDFGGMAAKSMVAGGQQISATADMASKQILKTQIEDNERDAKSQDVEFSKELSAITYGNDENEGYYASRGENAIKSYGDVQKNIEETRKARLDAIQNPRVREMFESASTTRTAREGESMSRHVQAQRRVANDTVSEARLNEAADDAGRAHNDNKVIGQSLGIARAEVADMGERNGWAPEVVASKMQEAQTVIHRSVINAAMVQDPMAAQAYYDKNKDKIDGRVHAEIEKALEAGTLRKQSQDAEDSIMSRGLDEASAMKAARAIKDPKVRDETVARIGNRFAENARIEARKERESKQAAWDVVKKGGTTDDLTPQQLAALPMGAFSSMREFEIRRAKDGMGYAKAPDPETETMLHRLFMDDKAAFAEYDMTQVIGKLDKPKYDYWTAQQRSLDKAGEKDKAKQANYSLADNIAKAQFLDPAGIKYGKGAPTSDAKKSAKVFELIRDVVDQMHADGKRATNDDITKALKELFLVGDVGGDSIFSRDKPAFNFIGTDDQGKFVLTDIPKQKQRISEVTGVPVDQIEAVTKGLNDAKVPVTAANIKAAYEKAHARGK